MKFDFNKKETFTLLNTGKEWKDRCNECCWIKCGTFGDYKEQCHCGNFDKKCKDCKHEDIVY